MVIYVGSFFSWFVRRDLLSAGSQNLDRVLQLIGQVLIFAVRSYPPRQDSLADPALQVVSIAARAVQHPPDR